MKYDEIIDRLGYFRNNANLSARETSLRLGYNPQFIKKLWIIYHMLLLF